MQRHHVVAVLLPQTTHDAAAALGRGGLTSAGIAREGEPEAGEAREVATEGDEAG